MRRQFGKAVIPAFLLHAAFEQDGMRIDDGIQGEMGRPLTGDLLPPPLLSAMRDRYPVEGACPSLPRIRP
jgi:hypothetical protein